MQYTLLPPQICSLSSSQQERKFAHKCVSAVYIHVCSNIFKTSKLIWLTSLQKNIYLFGLHVFFQFCVLSFSLSSITFRYLFARFVKLAFF